MDCWSNMFSLIIIIYTDRLLPEIQWSLYFKTTHETKTMWSYIAGGLILQVVLK